MNNHWRRVIYILKNQYNNPSLKKIALDLKNIYCLVRLEPQRVNKLPGLMQRRIVCPRSLDPFYIVS